ncbi:unnamed protein product [Caenorhabditis auriculariae]|uniref:Kinase n=1 Tax=Caenorhabditis auriculariae TaxID=2777116 RepID=A0A8S1HMV9_9PELO|nr:unnamed protein product [Caenorhabditis auriculariae]
MFDRLWLKVMGANSSRRDEGGGEKHVGCCPWRTSAGEDKAAVALRRPTKLPSKLRNKIRKQEDRSREWEEIPTPSVCDHRDTITEETPLSALPQDRLMHIINCFPYPTTRSAESPTPEMVAAIAAHDLEHRAFVDAFGKLVQVSVETMAITALPMDVWLKERLKKWVQLSGHEGSIVPATKHTLYKKQCSNCSESRAYESISRDPALSGFTPTYYKQLEKNEEYFIEIEDLLQQFADPTKTAIMDIKVGTRTFLESEVSNSKKRADLYEKMIAIDPEEPTDEERKSQSITKLRYMQFRERESSSAKLGFRIEAGKTLDGSLEKNFKKVRTIEDVASTFIDFFGVERTRVRRQLVARLKAMRAAIEKSNFFQNHEVVGSSILIMYDEDKVGCWMIDFAKTSAVVGKTLDHRTAWVPGNNEDGYLVGIDNLIKVLEEMPDFGQLPNEETLVTEEVVARLRESAKHLSS